MKVLLVCGLNRALSPFQLSHALQISIGNKCNAKQHIKSSLARELHKHTHTHSYMYTAVCVSCGQPARLVVEKTKRNYYRLHRHSGIVNNFSSNVHIMVVVVASWTLVAHQPLAGGSLTIPFVVVFCISARVACGADLIASLLLRVFIFTFCCCSRRALANQTA